MVEFKVLEKSLNGNGNLESIKLESKVNVLSRVFRNKRPTILEITGEKERPNYLDKVICKQEGYDFEELKYLGLYVQYKPTLRKAILYGKKGNPLQYFNFKTE